MKCIRIPDSMFLIAFFFLCKIEGILKLFLSNAGIEEILEFLWKQEITISSKTQMNTSLIWFSLTCLLFYDCTARYLHYATNYLKSSRTF